jgi:hypothetical protein
MYQFVVYNEYACELARSNWFKEELTEHNFVLFNLCNWLQTSKDVSELVPGDSIMIVKKD